jgi:hypothetical protein
LRHPGARAREDRKEEIVRIAATLAIVFATTAPLIAAADAPSKARHQPPRNEVFLGDSKVFDAIRAQDPARYDRIIDVLRVAQAEPCEDVPRVLKTQYRIDAKCQLYQVYTSFPAKTMLHFTIEDTNYTAYVVQKKLSAGKLVPADERSAR